MCCLTSSGLPPKPLQARNDRAASDLFACAVRSRHLDAADGVVCRDEQPGHMRVGQNVETILVGSRDKHRHELRAGAVRCAMHACDRVTRIKEALDELELHAMPVGEIVNGIARHRRDGPRESFVRAALRLAQDIRGEEIGTVGDPLVLLESRAGRGDQARTTGLSSRPAWRHAPAPAPRCRSASPSAPRQVRRPRRRSRACAPRSALRRS